MAQIPVMSSAACLRVCLGPLQLLLTHSFNVSDSLATSHVHKAPVSRKVTRPRSARLSQVYTSSSSSPSFFLFFSSSSLVTLIKRDREKTNKQKQTELFSLPVWHARTVLRRRADGVDEDGCLQQVLSGEEGSRCTGKHRHQHADCQ